MAGSFIVQGGVPTQIEPYTQGTRRASEPAIAPLTNGGYVITWFDDVADFGNGDTIYLSIVDANGATVGDPIVAISGGTSPSEFRTSPDIAVLSNGNIALTWLEEDPSGTSINYRIFNASGVAQTSVLTAATTSASAGPSEYTAPAIEALRGGGFALSWARAVPSTGSIKSEVIGRFFNNAGTATSGEISYDSETVLGTFATFGSTYITQLNNGNVIWGYDVGIAGTGIRLVITDTSGSVVTAPFDPRELTHLPMGFFSVEPLGNGNFMVIMTYNLDTTGAVGVGESLLIRRVFDPTGTPLTDDFAVVSVPQERRFGVSTTTDGAGGVLIMYTEELPEATGNNAFVVHVDQNGDVLGDPMWVNPGILGDANWNAITELSSGDFAFAARNPFAGGGIIHAKLFSGNDPRFTDGNDSVQLVAGGETVAALDGDDTVTGNSGDDKIAGGRGADSLRGNNGDDIVNGQAGDDNIGGGSGNDLIRGDAGQDTIFGGANDDYIDGGPDGDRIFAGSGNDTVIGGGGADTIFGGEGDDEISGSRDLFLNSGPFNPSRDANVTNELDGGDGNDTVTGGQGDDIIIGGDGDDLLDGSGGNDTIEGNGGKDTLLGGSGNDLLLLNDGDALFGLEDFNGQLGFDTLIVTGGAGTIGHGLNNQTVRFIEAIQFGPIAAGGDRTIIIDTGQLRTSFPDLEQIIGLDVAGSTEVLRIQGTSFGTRSVDLSGLTFLDWGGQGERVDYFDDAGNTSVIGTNQVDRIFGQALDDTIEGGAGADLIDGGDDFDTASYRSSDAAVVVDLSFVLRTSGGHAQGDRLVSIEGIIGSDHDDTLVGNKIANKIHSGGGNDTITGGSGADIFSFDIGDGIDRITDFDVGTDLIDLSTSGVEFSEISIVDESNSVRVTYSTALRGEVVIDGVTASQLTQASFILDTTPQGPRIAETGTIALTDTGATITLSQSYIAPVVFAFVATENGVQAVNVRVTEITGNTLSMRLQEPNHLDGSHNAETVNYLVAEKGSWILPDGTKLEVGTLTSNQLSSAGFSEIDFDSEFDATPVVLSQVQTDNGADFVTTRQQNADSDGFELTMQEEEALNGGGHASETIGWLAIDEGTGRSGDLVWAAGTASVVTNATSSVDVGVAMGDGVNAIANLSSFADAEPAWARGGGNTTTTFDVSAEEDKSLDGETTHGPGGLNYFSFDHADTINSAPLQHVFETGTTTLTHVAQTITLQSSYVDPVVIAFVATENGAQPVVVRVTGLSGDQLTMRLQEPNHLDGNHAGETVNFIVAEKGDWVLPDGTRFVVGDYTQDFLSSSGFSSEGYGASFDQAPVMFTQVQTFNGADFVTSRVGFNFRTGFESYMQEELANNGGGHAEETIGFIAMEAGRGSIGDLTWIAGRASNVTYQNATVNFGEDLGGPALAVAALTSINGVDPAWTRGNGSTSMSFNVSIEEDTSQDAETDHSAETVDYFAFNKAATVSAYGYDFLF